MTVPPYGLRVPTGADLPDVPFDLTNLATDVSDQIERLDADLAKLNFTLVRAGNWFAAAITGPTSTTISFGATFSAPPLIHLSWYDGQYGAATSDNVTTTGATLYAAPITSTTIVRVTWLALGQKP